MPDVHVDPLDGALAWRQHDGGHTDEPNVEHFIQWAKARWEEDAHGSPGPSGTCTTAKAGSIISPGAGSTFPCCSTAIAGPSRSSMRSMRCSTLRSQAMPRPSAAITIPGWLTNNSCRRPSRAGSRFTSTGAARTHGERERPIVRITTADGPPERQSRRDAAGGEAGAGGVGRSSDRTTTRSDCSCGT